MTATYTFDVFTTLDGFGSYNSDGDWGGYWSKEGPEFVDHRLALYGAEQRTGPRGQHLPGLHAAAAPDTAESTPAGPPDADDADDGGVVDAGRPRRLAGRDPRERRRRRRHRAAQGGVRPAVALARQPVAEPGADGRRPRRLVQVSIFPVISGQTGSDPILRDAADFDLELLESRLFDGRIQELIYRPTLH